MEGFEWSPTAPYVSTVEGGDGWCLRDAVCRLLGWEPGSVDWLRFIEGPHGKDTSRLAGHLGLAEFQVPQDWNDLIGRLDHPGMAVFGFHVYQKSHAVYVHDLRWLLHHWPASDGRPARSANRRLWRYGWPLRDVHMIRGPVLGEVLVDEQQSPRE